MSEEPLSNEVPPPPARSGDEATLLLADMVAERLRAAKPITAPELYALADQCFGGSQAQGAYSGKDAHDAAELAVNLVLSSRGRACAPEGPPDHALAIVAEIEALTALLPSQTRRDDDTVALQQFSTPPAYGFVLAWVAGVTEADQVAEPSAGNGNLAVHAMNAGAKVHANEIAERRLVSLRALGLQPTTENGEQIHNILRGLVSPTVVVMNPPFSRSIRTGDAVDPSVAGMHVEAALELLADGGRLVAITGRATGSGSGRGSWMTRVRTRYAVRANVMVSGRVYARHGTTVETRVVVIDKVRDDCAPIMGEAASLPDLVRILAPVRRTAASDNGGDARFAAYRPAKLQLPGVQPHPDRLVESCAMAAVQPPDLHYVPHFPATLWTEGRISAAQLEAVCYAGQAHCTDLIATTDGVPWRRGYAIGDGTGVGKGREIAAIIMDNFHQGHRRHVWVTANDTKLMAAAKRDLEAVSGDPRLVFSLRASTRAGEPVTVDSGVMLVSMGTLRSNKPERSRLDQIVRWCGGADFSGCLVIDEGHKAGNGIDEDGERGKAAASQTAMAAIDIQKRLPRAKVVYVSATQADQPKNLAYCLRLGLFGEGTPFSGARAFCSAIEAAGIAGMEIVARDLKAMGRYCARTLSMAGVVCERLVHHLNPDQEATYNSLAEAWQYVYTHIDPAMIAAGSRKNSTARSSALSAFYGAQQRFFNQVLISMQMPTVLTSMEKDLDAGHSPVIQLVNTLEAQQERALAAEGAMENLDDLDLTPRDVLAQYIQQSFPTRAYEEYRDAEGNVRTRPVVDSKGDPVFCQEAVAMKERLLVEVGQLKVPHGPLELLLDRFGVDTVAELTGRSRRVVLLPDPETGIPTRRIQARGPAAVMADLRSFWDDEKRIVVFSGAANEGIDLNSGRRYRNQRKRRHYIVQAGFNAKAADQGRGRTLRTDSVCPPDYILVTTGNKAQMRFISTIARRLGALGAMTKGQRDTASGGLFTERDNLESSYGQAAVHQLIREIHAGDGVAGFSLIDLEMKMGLQVTDKEGSLCASKMPPVRRFLNRLLSLTVADGNAMFEEFAARMEDIVQAAIDNGTYLQGVEVYSAERIELVAPARQVYREPVSGAETQYVHLRAWHRRTPRDFAEVAAGRFGTADRIVKGWVREKLTGAVFALAQARHRMGDDGKLIPQFRLVGPYEEMFKDEAVVRKASGPFVPIGPTEARKLWSDATSMQDELRPRDLHLICGVLLPVWHRVEGSWTVYRVTDEHGNQYLGRLIQAGQVRTTLTRLGATLEHGWTPFEVEQAVLTNVPFTLANGWRLKRARVSNEWRVEVTGWVPGQITTLRTMGMVMEYISYQYRAFVPIGNTDVMTALLEQYPVAEAEALTAAA